MHYSQFAFEDHKIGFNQITFKGVQLLSKYYWGNLSELNLCSRLLMKRIIVLGLRDAKFYHKETGNGSSN